MQNPSLDSITGCLLGGAIGDALGLPYERVKSSRINRLFGPIDHKFTYHFIMRRGMISDDTEHSLFTAMAMGSADGDPEKFAKSLAGHLKRWIIALPAGVGKATLIASWRLVFAVSPERSGVFSAGNGPAMRATIIGVLAKDDQELIDFVQRSSRITHLDPKAEFGALAVAVAGRYSSRFENFDADDYLKYVSEIFTRRGSQETSDFLDVIHQVVNSVKNHQTTQQFAEQMGLQNGVSGYIYHTVPIVLHAWLTNPQDYDEGILSVIRCGGDTDTTAAITGGIIGARVGKKGIPGRWIDGMKEFPFSIKFIEELAKSLAQSNSQTSIPFVYFPIILLRNFVFFIIILLHVFRRLFPPY